MSVAVLIGEISVGIRIVDGCEGVRTAAAFEDEGEQIVTKECGG